MIKIVTDSDANLPRNMLLEYGISMVPISIIFGEETLRDEIELTPEAGYKRMATDPNFPKTSQPSPGDFTRVYEKVLADDPSTTILAVCVSGGVSATVNSAQQAADLIPEATIRVFDTRSVSLGQGLMVRQAAQMARGGASLDDILDTLEKMRDGMNVVFAVKTLENLAKGGRLGRASYLMANMLEIRPLLTIQDGVLDAHSRHRTWGRAVGAMTGMVIEEASVQQGKGKLHLGVVHANNPTECKAMYNVLVESIHPDVYVLGEVSLGLGVHSGPGALGVCWVVLPE